MDNPITRAEHEEFRRRLEEENRRQDKRIELLEDNMRELNQLTASVGKLATSIESMVKEQEKQGKRLETLEDRDGAMWRIRRLCRSAAWFELRKRGTYELENQNQEPGILGADRPRRVCDGSGLCRSDRCGHDHLGGRVADHQGHGGKSVLPVFDCLQRVVGV